MVQQAARCELRALRRGEHQWHQQQQGQQQVLVPHQQQWHQQQPLQLQRGQRQKGAGAGAGNRRPASVAITICDIFTITSMHHCMAAPLCNTPRTHSSAAWQLHV